MSVEIQQLSYHYPDGTCALMEITLNLPAGKRIAVLGINGSGKTTLLYHLNGTLLPQQGKVTVLGEPVQKNNLKNLRKKVGFLFDYPDHQLFATTIARDVAFGPRNLQLGEEEIHKRVREALDNAGLRKLSEKPPYQLSYGQKKRTAIAGVTAMEPDLIVCDEPFAGLDPYAQKQFQLLLNQWVSTGKSLIFSTHDMELAYAWADETVLMSENRVLAYGPTVKILQDQSLMNQARLPRPILAQLFENQTEKPRSIEEALKKL